MALNVPQVTPVPGSASAIASGGVAVQAAPGNINGGYITNPASAADQGLVTPENLYINPVTAASLEANGTTVVLSPGQTFSLIPGTTLPTWANAETTGHQFTVVVY
jgi:hypothetical protein